VRIAFDQLDPRILPDMGIKVAFLDAAPAGDAAQATKTRAVRVARGAIRGSLGQEFVFVVRPDATLERRAVTLGPGGDDPAEVLGGLSAGDRVVLAGPSDLAAGIKVTESKPKD
jgi:multidrug efflux pump subunit AcrA (membrane-fusion protein)